MTSAHDDDPATERLAAGRAALIHGLFWDVGLPVASYYGLRLGGASEWVALLAATLAAGLRIVWVALRDRRLNPFATVLLIMFGVGLTLVLVSGDPRFLLLKHSITGGAIGIAFLISIIAGRPLTLAAAQSWQPGIAQELQTLYRDNPAVRQEFQVSATVWGLGGLAEALIRIPLIYLLPIDVMVGLSTALMVVTNGGLLIWNLRYSAGRQRLLGQATGDPLPPEASAANPTFCSPHGATVCARRVSG